MVPYGNMYIWVNIGSDNGLLTDGAQPLPEPMLTPLRAKFFRRNKNIHLHVMSFLHTDVTQVVEIEPEHQQPWYWPSETESTRSPHVKG